MKRILFAVLLLVLTATARTSLAAPVFVDFSALGMDTVDITSASNPDGLTLNGVTFKYDDLGSGTDFAAVDAAGVFGTTGGSLMLDFSTPAKGLSFDFSLLGVSEDVSDALFITFIKNGSSVADLFLAAGSDGSGSAPGTLFFGGPEFDRALMLFSLDAPFFSVGNLSYESTTAPVPEPATFILFASGLLGLVGVRRFGRRC